jgi:hypothetical protein
LTTFFGGISLLYNIKVQEKERFRKIWKVEILLMDKVLCRVINKGRRDAKLKKKGSSRGVVLLG